MDGREIVRFSSQRNHQRRVGAVNVKGKLEHSSEVLLFMGPGRGKTTAALGVALRIIGNGGRVVFIHFTGPQYPELGEVKFTAALGDRLRMIGIKSEVTEVSYLDGFSECVDTVREALAMAQNIWIRECNLLVLDDIGAQLEQESIDAAQVLTLIEERSPDVSIILTGRSLPRVIMEAADLITQCVDVKHRSPADMGPRKGINF